MAVGIQISDGATLKPGRIKLKGIAFDGGSGIKEVAVSIDGGKAWMLAGLSKRSANGACR